MQLRKNNNLETRGPCLLGRQKQAGYRHPRFSVAGGQREGTEQQLLFQKRASLTLSQMALGKPSLFLKNFIEGVLAPSLKEK